MLRNALSAFVRFYKGLLYDEKGTPSLGRHVLATVMALIVFTTFDLGALLWYVAVTRQLAEAAGIAQAIATSVAAGFGVLSALGGSSYLLSKLGPALEARLGMAPGSSTATMTTTTTTATETAPIVISDDPVNMETANG